MKKKSIKAKTSQPTVPAWIEKYGSGIKLDKPMIINDPKKMRAKVPCFLPIIAYKICPPSNCPIGIRFSAVMKRPNHPTHKKG